MSSYEISKSSLLSLKAEILRKQDELTKAKIENVEKIKSIKKKALEIKNKGVEERQLNDLNEEEQDLLTLSKSKLEAKSRLYDKLSGYSQDEETNRRYLVRFDKKEKIQNEISPEDTFEVPDLPLQSDEEEKHDSDYYDEDVDSTDEWVEYTDCLGRSRKCLRKDLDYIKSQDADLKLLAEKRHQSHQPCENEQTETINPPEETEDHEQEVQVIDEEKEMISGDMRRDMLRKQWEKEEEELKNKSDIHYQNVLFNEARQHGVGYYGFSKDEAERAKQQEALKRIRVETQQQQKKAQDLKALREKQMAARMKAARNRRRARLGLPPEEDEPAPTEPDKEKENENKKDQEQEKLEATEKLLAEARKRHVRPWDIGKEGVKEFYKMTQEEWNDKKRQERPTEFAPPVTYNKREFTSMKSLEHSLDDGDKSLKFSSRERKKTDEVKKQKLRNINPYKHSDSFKDANEQSDDDCLMTDYKQSDSFIVNKNNTYEPEHPTSEAEDNDSDVPSKNTADRMEPVPIRNEIEEDFQDALLADYHEVATQAKKEKSKRKGAEIAPPATFEYFGPESKKARNPSEQINITESIEAGLKFLRKQAERKRRRREDDIF